MSMQIRFWGVRGSIASPGPDTVRAGGNTSCVEVIAGDTRLVLDAGTGLRRLGSALSSTGAVDATVLLSHLHWDHIQGIPFFTPLYSPETRLHFVGGAGSEPLRDSLKRQMSAPNFPVALDDVPAKLAFTEVRDKERFVVGEARVVAAKANHPDAVHAYRIEHGGRSIVYATDTEHYACVDQRLVSLARDADVLIYDAQYLPEEYSGEVGMSRVGWGHSTYEAGIALARAAGARRLVLFHHDPTRTDDGVDEIEARARKTFPDAIAAREGLVLELESDAVRAA
jgi:phosphoribosyl 1,2-cyclic phosphodiesterase